MTFTYKAHKQTAELFTAYQTIIEDGDHIITTSQLMTCIRVITSCIETLFKNTENLHDFSATLTNLTRSDLTTENLLKSMEKYPLKRQEEKVSAKEAKQSHLLKQFGLMKQQANAASLASSQSIDDQRESVIKAIKTLRGFFQKDAACYIRAIESNLPTVEAEKEIILAKLMPEISEILDIHIRVIVTDINLEIFQKNFLNVDSGNKPAAVSSSDYHSQPLSNS
jgi:hypothetical protein